MDHFMEEVVVKHNSTFYYVLYVMAWIMLVIITVVTALLFWSRSKWVYDD